MKRFVAILLVLSMMLSLTGCAISFDKEAFADHVKEEISEAVDEAVDEAKAEVSKKVEEAVDEAKTEASQKVDDVIDGVKTEVGQITDELPKTGEFADEFPKTSESVTTLPQTGETEKSWFENLIEGIDNFLRGDLTITFDPNGGTGGPKEQKFKENTYPSMPDADKNPTKEGYHFVGWAPEGSDEPQFFSGMRTWCAFSQDTTLHACWEEYDPDDPFTVHESTGKSLNFGGFFESIGGSAGTYIFPVNHDYHLTTQNQGRVIRIQCDCGLELIDRDISKDNFVKIKSNGEKKTFDSLEESKKEEYNKDWILYRTQDFAPVVISLIGSFYESFEAVSQDFSFDKDELKSFYDSYDYDVVISSLSDFFDDLKDISDFEAEVAKLEYAPENVDLKFTYYDHNCKGQTIAQVLSQMRAEDISKPYREFANKYFSTISKGSKYASTAIGIGRAIYYGYDAFGSDEIVTERTLSMVKAIHAVVAFCPAVGDYYDNLFSTLEEGLELYDKCCKYQSSFYALLSEILEGTIDIEGINLSLLDVDQARIGNFDGTPSVVEVLGYLMKTAKGSEKNNYSLLSKDQKTLVIWYLTMRLEYDFQREYGIKLEDYKEYIK